MMPEKPRATLFIVGSALLGCLHLFSTTAAASAPELPVIDVHLHALPADAQGPPPLGMCTPMTFPEWDPAEDYVAKFIGVFKNPPCEDPVWSPETDEALLAQTIDVMERNNVFGILSGNRERVAAWREAAPGRFLPGLGFRLGPDAPDPADLEALHAAGDLAVFAEITNQYAGIAPGDERMAPYWEMAERLDLPVGIHIGTGPPGAPYLGTPGYRARLHSALTLEPVLVDYPKLRVYIMHAGYPMLDDVLALMYNYPQVYVGLGVIIYTQPRAAFYRYLQGLVDAGFGRRILFGSDQMVWPGTIERAIRVIEDAPFLSEEQKRDILYNNAARFLRLSEQEIAAHHGAR